MIGGMLLMALLGQADVDFEKIDCKGQCQEMVDMCLVGCEQESKAGKKRGEKAMDCKEVCGPAADRCKEACKQLDAVKGRAKSMKGMKVPEGEDDDDHSHGGE